MTALISVLFIVSCACLVLAAEDELVVKVKNGMLRGKYLETKKGRRIMGYTGIPYAKPPLGNLRFQPPVPADDWNGIKDATNDKHNICYQNSMFSLLNMFSMDMSEDCLFLNVYTPKIDKNDLLPVMVWIHGGAFHTGFANLLMYSPGILLDKDVILVSMNYRLGPLGFITTGDTVVPGNMGLKDQSLALKWVKENIINFGGDPDSITIFGESAGGASTHLQMLSPQNKGLFHGVISQSGNGVSTWGLVPHSRGLQLTKRLASMLDCDTENSKAMLDCMLKLDAKEINDKQGQFAEWDSDPIIIFGPVIEPDHKTAFISKTPEYILKNKLGSDVPWVTGITTEEGVLRSAAIMANPAVLHDFNEKYFDIAHLVFTRNRSKNTDEIAKRMKEFYYGDDDIDYEKEKELTDMYTDTLFSYASHKAITLHKKYSNQPIYNYLFAYRGPLSISAVYSGTDKNYGVAHGDDLLYLFPIYDTMMPNLDLPEDHLKMQEMFLTLWTNFAKYRNPTPEGSKSIWKAVETEGNEYLRINNSDELIMEKEMMKERIDFWKSLEHLFVDKDGIRDEL